MKTALMIDVSNLYFTIEKLHVGKRLMLLDYAKHLESLGHVLTFKIAYSRQSAQAAQSFTHMLNCNGFETHFGTGPWQVAMALRASEILDSVDCLIIGSNNQELHPVLAFARKAGKITKCFACDVQPATRKFAEVIEIPEALLRVKNELDQKAGAVAVPSDERSNGA